MPFFFIGSLSFLFPVRNKKNMMMISSSSNYIGVFNLKKKEV